MAVLARIVMCSIGGGIAEDMQDAKPCTARVPHLVQRDDVYPSFDSMFLSLR